MLQCTYSYVDNKQPRSTPHLHLPLNTYRIREACSTSKTRISKQNQTVFLRLLARGAAHCSKDPARGGMGASNWEAHVRVTARTAPIVMRTVPHHRPCCCSFQSKTVLRVNLLHLMFRVNCNLVKSFGRLLRGSMKNSLNSRENDYFDNSQDETKSKK